MIEIIQSETFQRRLSSLKIGKPCYESCPLRRLSQNNPSDAKPLREGISELRIDYGPGYRVYFMQRGSFVIVLLAGGDKRTQDSDIARAIDIAKDWKTEP